MNSFIS